MKTPSFAKDIKPLFRAQDIETMQSFGLDLSSFQDVRLRADAILERLEIKDMPCDGGWPAASIDTFKRWIAEGMPA
jgi:hypothetical protein